MEFLEKNLHKSHEVFEFGCGTSTLFFAKRTKKVVGVETNVGWYESLITRGYSNIEIALMEDGLTNDAYENSAKNSGQKFDFILIDSLKRFACARNSLAALKPAGAIILDDSQRENYKKIFDFFAEAGFTKQDFWGEEISTSRIKNTTIFFA
ncbi:MAG: class I SAM-dependent methyltransferase [Alphaproteobacteria bacterium]|nr:class I SAM-dependent methyltransferase [Alphaproteobacteria bacterium]